MKKFTFILIVALCCLNVSNIQARRVTYYSHVFTKVSNSWTAVSGIDTSATAFAEGYLIFTGNGTGDMQVALTSKISCDNFEYFHLDCVYQGIATKIRFNTTYEDSTHGVFETTLQSNAELTQAIDFKADNLVSGTIPKTGVKVVYQCIQLVGAGKDDIFGMLKIYGKSTWVYPTIPATGVDSVRTEAEDYDEGGFGVGYFSHITAAQNSYRSEDPYLYISTQSGASNNKVISDMGKGSWTTSGLPDSLKIGQATRTLANLYDFYKQWVQYTIVVTKDITGATLSLKTGVYGSTWTGFNNTVYDPYVNRYHSAYTASLDGVNLIGAAGSDTVHLIPNWSINNGNSWTCYLPAVPSFSNVNLTAGTHVLRITSCCGQWTFDAFDFHYTSSPVSLSNNVVDKKITVYPNPAESVINISNSDVDYVIMDITGAKRLAGRGTSVDVSALAPGMYFIAADGQQAKFLKK